MQTLLDNKPGPGQKLALLSNFSVTVYCRFAREVTAVMLVTEIIYISLLWKFNSIFS